MANKYGNSGRRHPPPSDMKTRCSASAQKNRTELQASIAPPPNLSCLTARRRSGAQAPLDAGAQILKRIGLGSVRERTVRERESCRCQQPWGRKPGKRPISGNFLSSPILPIEHGYGPPSGPLPSTSRQHVNTRWAVLECYKALTHRQTPIYDNKGICLLSTGYLYLFSGPHRVTC
jgi:hypothetical protein